MQRFIKEWLDAAAAAAGTMAGLPYEPVDMKRARNDNSAQLELPLAREIGHKQAA